MNPDANLSTQTASFRYEVAESVNDFCYTGARVITGQTYVTLPPKKRRDGGSVNRYRYEFDAVRKQKKSPVCGFDNARLICDSLIFWRRAAVSSIAKTPRVLSMGFPASEVRRS